MALFSAQFSALHYFIFGVYTNLNSNRMLSSTFQIFLLIFNKIQFRHVELLNSFSCNGVFGLAAYKIATTLLLFLGTCNCILQYNR